MRRHGRRPMLAHERQILLALLVVGAGENLALRAQPLDQPGAMAAALILLPVGGIGAAEAEQRLLRDAERQVVGGHLEGQDDDVDVEEEIEVDVDDAQLDGLVALRERQAHLGDVGAPHRPDRALAVAALDGAAQALAVEEALHRRQEGDELVVVPLLELGGIAELVVELAPRIVGIGLGEVLPVVLHRGPLLERRAVARARAGSGADGGSAWCRRESRSLRRGCPAAWAVLAAIGRPVRHRPPDRGSTTLEH